MLVFFLDALLEFLDGKALHIGSLVADALNAPAPAFLREGEDCPVPVPSDLFVDDGSHRHLGQRAAQRCLPYLQRPDQLDLFARGRAAAVERWYPETGALHSLGFALAYKAEFDTSGMGLVDPVAASLNPFVALQTLAQPALTAQHVVVEGVIAQSPGAGEGGCNLVGFQRRVDESLAAILARVGGFEDQLVDGRQVMPVLLMGRGTAPFIDGKRVFDEAAALRQRSMEQGNIGQARLQLAHVLVEAAFGEVLDDEILDALLPEIEQEAHHTYFIVFVAFLPCEDKLDFALFSRLRDVALPETGWLAHKLDEQRAVNRRLPAWVDL